MSKSATEDICVGLARRHLRAGWVGLLVFLSLGIALETFHGLKLDYYLDLRNQPRRLTWTLAHAHGTLFAIINIVFALTLSSVRQATRGTLKFASVMLIGGMLVMPTGFFVSGLWLLGSEPGIGIFLVPIGACMMLFGVSAVLLSLRGWDTIPTPAAEETAPAAAAKPAKKNPRRRKP